MTRKPTRKIIACLAFLAYGLHVFAVAPNALANSPLALTPLPQSVSVAGDKPGIAVGKTICLDLDGQPELIKDHLHAFAAALRLNSSRDVVLSSERNAGSIHLAISMDRSLDPEAYTLQVQKDRIHIRASTIKGVAHATSTLLQLLGAYVDQAVPSVSISDYPDNVYRSFMVDLGRNPHSLEVLKETIDLLWFYKVDSLHLHLTDDQYIAFPSRAFPKLASEQGKITWEEFESLEHYAHSRGVTLIPELEVPGHSGLLRRHYPEVFGNSSTDVAKLTSSREAIKVLLDEMMELFPSSPYIHIGGDEAFGVPEELQRDLINELHVYLKRRGKKTLVWEGPRLGEGDNKVNEEVIHINWRTVNFPADQMLKAGYPVVNAAWDPLYLVDHYPRNNFTMASPEHIYRTLDIRRFSHFNPGIQTFANPIQTETAEGIIGFCMPWWEGREVNYLPMIVPRVIPMAAVAWNTQQENDYENFAERTETCEATRESCFYPVTIAASPLVLESDGVFHNQTTVELKSRIEGELHYTTDGQPPTADSPTYVEPFELDKSATVRAAVFVDGRPQGHGSRRTLVHVAPVENLALGKPVTSSATSGPPFSIARLTDGGTGELDYYLGYPTEPEPISITVDLQATTAFNRVVINSFAGSGACELYDVYVSKDGEAFTQVASRQSRSEEVSSETVHDIPATEARYVRIVTRGCKGYVFDSFSKLTEIQVFQVD